MYMHKYVKKYVEKYVNQGYFLHGFFKTQLEKTENSTIFSSKLNWNFLKTQFFGNFSKINFMEVFLLLENHFKS